MFIKALHSSSRQNPMVYQHLPRCSPLSSHMFSIFSHETHHFAPPTFLSHPLRLSPHLHGAGSTGQSVQGPCHFHTLVAGTIWWYLMNNSNMNYWYLIPNWCLRPIYLLISGTISLYPAISGTQLLIAIWIYMNLYDYSHPHPNNNWLPNISRNF